VVCLTLTAGQQFNELLDHYIRLDREKAVDRLVAALRDALANIENNPAAVGSGSSQTSCSRLLTSRAG